MLFEKQERRYSSDPMIASLEEGQGIEKATSELVLGRKVVDWSNKCGEDEVRSPEFFGIKLEKTNSRPAEWLILAIPRSSSWLDLDGRYIQDDPHAHYGDEPPMYSERLRVDKVRPKIVGKVLRLFDVDESSASIHIGESRLNLYGHYSTRMSYPTGERKKLADGEDLRNAFVLSQNPRIQLKSS